MMALLFAFGVMSLPWVALLAVAITVEKVAPAGDRVSKWLGAILLLAGTGLMVGIVGP
jgi:predicted metal-binding membrane protein